MSYQVFARKYRPQSFEDVLGQEGVVQTLTNAIRLNRVHQAYLFCGARGVGKTSLARIFAKSLNCEKGPTVTPCQTCPSCVGVTSGRSMDVLEIDGASNTGVDDVRELREQVKYLPHSGKYKITIIDEVHMLSTSAFNALLKTLEEPPPHVLFIFATTEPHKIPITILSRCQRFDCRRLSVPQLTGHLAKILAQEKLQFSEESLSLIARCGDGSVRDSLSLLDQIVSYCGDKPTLEQVRDVLGLADRALLFEMMDAILAGEVSDILRLSESLYLKGSDLKIFAEGLLEVIHRLLLLSSGGQVSEISPGEEDFLKKAQALSDPKKLLVLFQILAKSVEDIARASFPRMVFEVALIKMAQAKDLLLLPEILEKLKSAPPEVVSQPNRPLVKTSVGTQVASPPVAPRGAAVAPDISGNLASFWMGFVRKVCELRPQIGAILEHAVPVKQEGEKIVIGFAPKTPYADMLKERMALLMEASESYFQKPMQFDICSLEKIEKGSTPFEIRQQAEQKRSAEIKAQALANPMVQKAQELLGASVKEVKEIK